MDNGGHATLNLSRNLLQESAPNVLKVIDNHNLGEGYDALLYGLFHDASELAATVKDVPSLKRAVTQAYEAKKDLLHSNFKSHIDEFNQVLDGLKS
ncbi:MAG: hypothetical protein QE263_01680 [Vampirovibrionales bacterium]|nr:hypothetical protein [Vampirovibrionales bacterium]